MVSATVVEFMLSELVVPVLVVQSSAGEEGGRVIVYKEGSEDIDTVSDAGAATSTAAIIGAHRVSLTIVVVAVSLSIVAEVVAVSIAALASALLLSY